MQSSTKLNDKNASMQQYCTRKEVMLYCSTLYLEKNFTWSNCAVTVSAVYNVKKGNRSKCRREEKSDLLIPNWNQALDGLLL